MPSLITDWKTPGTAANVDRDAKHPWSNPDNAKTDNDTYADCHVTKDSYGDWLRLTNFGFTTSDVPVGSIIDGIEVKIQRYAQTAVDISDSALYLRNAADSQTGDNKASAVKWASSEEEVTRGALGDDWNASLVDTDVIHINFGVDLSAANSNQSSDIYAYIDVISIRIHYTTTATVTTQAVDNVESIQADGHGTITVSGGEQDKRGICWNTTGAPDVNDNIAEDSSPEEQTQDDSVRTLYSGSGIAMLGQRRTINNTTVTSLSFKLRKYPGNPTGNATLGFRKVSDDGVIVSNTIDVSTLDPNAQTWETLILTPTLINEEIRLYFQYDGGDASNVVRCSNLTRDVKAGECEAVYLTGDQWYDLPWTYPADPSINNDGTYKFTCHYALAAFTKKMTGLSPSTKYYVRAYAHTTAGYSYGAEVNFTTPPLGHGFTNFQVPGIA